MNLPHTQKRAEGGDQSGTFGAEDCRISTVVQAMARAWLQPWAWMTKWNGG